MNYIDSYEGIYFDWHWRREEAGGGGLIRQVYRALHSFSCSCFALSPAPAIVLSSSISFLRCTPSTSTPATIFSTRLLMIDVRRRAFYKIHHHITFPSSHIHSSIYLFNFVRLMKNHKNYSFMLFQANFVCFIIAWWLLFVLIWIRIFACIVQKFIHKIHLFCLFLFSKWKYIY